MSLYRGIGSAEYMTKWTPRNAKYEHVKTKLDTGCSITKYMEKMEDIKKNYRYRKDEIFKRLKVTTFAQLILQVTSVSGLNETIDGESVDPADGVSVACEGDLESVSERSNTSAPAPLPADPQEAAESRESCRSARSTLHSLVTGVGELNLQRPPQETTRGPDPGDTPYPDCPYLLLDVRDRDQYECCHIISASSFPITMLARTMNPYTKEILQYKNAAGKIIVVYDEDERMAIQVATSMCQRGFENLFLLSGGLKVVAQKFPEGLTTGSLPPSCLSPGASRRRRSSAPPVAAERRCRFTPDELNKIQEQLEEVYTPSSASSRVSSSMSSSSGRSKASGAQSRLSSCSSGGGRRVQSCRPWK
ncbi:centrosomal protein of 41 kDa [Antennarius striatus]|uniref:centrosomal protein of 41 kDa n=1 Tax=Antennarius striatus TaxID=241820 RepID=UPI0035B063A8